MEKQISNNESPPIGRVPLQRAFAYVVKYRVGGRPNDNYRHDKRIIPTE